MCIFSLRIWGVDTDPQSPILHKPLSNIMIFKSEILNILDNMTFDPHPPYYRNRDTLVKNISQVPKSVIL